MREEEAEPLADLGLARRIPSSPASSVRAGTSAGCACLGLTWPEIVPLAGPVDGQPDQVAGALTFEQEGDGVRTVRLLPGSTDLTIRRAAAAATLGPTCSANLIGGSTTSPLAISIAGECVERGHQAGPLFGAS